MAPAQGPEPDTRPRIALLVGGPPAGIMHIRAEGLTCEAHHVFDLKVFTHASGRGKVRDVLSMTAELLRFRPRAMYVLNTGAIGIPALVVRGLTGAPFVVDTGDLAYRFVRVMGYFGPARRLWIGFTEWLLITMASAVVVRGRFHRTLLIRHTAKPVVHIPDGVDVASRVSGDTAAERARRGWDGKITIGFLGVVSWSEQHDWGLGKELVEAVRLLGGERFHGVVIGDGSGRPYLEELARTLQVEGAISFVGSVPYADLPRELSMIDICLVTSVEDESWEVRTTGKLPEYLAAGRIVVATQVGEAKWVLDPEQILPYHGIGDPDYAGRLAEHIGRLALNWPAPLAVASESGPRLAREYFDYHVLSPRWVAVMNALIGR